MKTKSLEVAFSKLFDKLDGWFNTFIEMIPNLIIAVVVFLLFYLLSRWIGHLVTKILGRLSKGRPADKPVNRLISRLVSILIIMTGVFFALGLLHLDKTVTSLLAGIGIIGLALSFAFQHTAANILSGLIISLRSSVHIGDLIESNGVFGNVVRVGLRSTKVINVKGQYVDVPNRLLIDSTYQEFSKTGYRRIDVVGMINFRENLDEIREQAEKRMMKFDFLYEEKPPNFVFNEIHKEKIDFTLRVWMKFTNVDGEFLNARSKCLIELSKLFTELGVEVARSEVLYVDRNK